MDDNLKLEYQEVGHLFRHYTTFLINILQHFVAGNALLFIGLSYASKNGLTPSYILILISILGFSGSTGTLVVQIRTYRYWTTILKRGAEIEKLLKAKLYSNFAITGKKTNLSSSFFVCFLYTLFSIFWFIILLKVVGLLPNLLLVY